MQTRPVDAKSIIANAARKTLGIFYYRSIMARFAVCDVSKDIEFQQSFTYFYKVRRPKWWLDKFYAMFQSMRRMKALTFSEVLNSMYKMSDGKWVDLSFASKMLHTIDPDRPIYDRFVAMNLALDTMPQSGNAKSRIAKAIDIYGDLVYKMESLLALDSVKAELKVFDEAFPECKDELSSMKKLDYLLWSDKAVEASITFR